MKCPHCSIEVHSSFTSQLLNFGNGYQIGNYHGQGVYWSISAMKCPACAEAIFSFGPQSGVDTLARWLIYPRTSTRPPLPPEVPESLAADYDEAAKVLDLSPKASAALSRRCLQGTLRSQGFSQKDLAPAIEAAINSNTLPSAISSNLDAVRNIGNFAAHPMKDTSSGEILPVEPDEADWNLDVLDDLFDFYFVQPERAKAKRAALDAKLAKAGKPPMK